MNVPHHSHDHGHDHEHAHAPLASHAASAHTPAARNESRLLLAFGLTLITLLVEAGGGWWSGSLALIADAGHMLVDALALLLAWAGAHFSRRPPDARRSFGYARLEVLAAYSNALIQFLLVAWIVAEAGMRLFTPEPILSGVMFWIALAGLIVNALVLRVLHVDTHDHAGHDHGDEDLNLRSANLHVLGDLLGSLGAVVAALLIRYFGWLAADPILSIVVSLLILRGAWRLLQRSGHILLEGTPDGIEHAQVTAVLNDIAGVSDVHHLHLWQLVGGAYMATLHVRLTPGFDSDMLLCEIKALLRERYRIRHATVQIEVADCPDGRCEG
jgi:cobalt-zinc-cadmium efflux system protein